MKQGRAKSGDTTLYYRSVGKGEPILFIHEYAGDHRSWDDQVRYFSRYFQCITFNARGYPPSDIPAHPEDYSMQQAAQDAVAVLHALEIDKAHIVGLSMGSFATLQMALDYPAACHSITVVGTGTGSEPESHQEYKNIFRRSAQQINDLGMAEYVEQYALGSARQTLLKKDPMGWHLFKKHMAEHSPIGCRNTLIGVQAGRPSLWDLKDALAKIDLPALLMTGDKDLPTLQTHLMLNQVLKRSGLAILPRSGHAINIEEPALFNQLLQDFLFSVQNQKL